MSSKPYSYTVEIVTIHEHRDSGWFRGRCRAVSDPDNSKKLDFPGEFAISGVCPHVMEGLPYRLKAFKESWQGQPQLKIVPGTLERVESLIDLAGIDRYLLWIRTILNNTRKDAGLPSLGIGPKKITDLVSFFKKESVETLRSDPVKVALLVNGWKLEQAQAFSKELKNHIKTEKVLLELATLGANGALSANNRFELLDRYGFEAPDIVRKDPYKLIEEINGLGWRKADAIAVKNLLWPESSPHRIVAGTIEAMRQIESPSGPGHTYAIAQTLYYNGSVLTGVPRSYHEMFATDDPALTIQGPYVMSTKSFEAEEDIVSIIQERAARELSIPDLGHHKDSRHIQGLNDLQFQAYERAMAGGIFILSGGPGRGKTHVCKSIIGGLNARSRKVLILAPTGRAAARAKELTGNQALTIHSYLKRLSTGTDYSTFSTIIVDECSMIDLVLMGRFLRTLKDHQSCIFVGDPDQLPSVASGKPFVDIIASQLLEVIHLEEIMRTDKLGLIEASKIVNTVEHSKVADDLRYIQCESFNLVPLDGQKAKDAVQKIIYDMQLKGIPNKDIQIITATNGYKGEGSTVKVLSNKDFNHLVKPMLNGRGLKTKATCKGGDVLSTGDRIMNLKNDASIPLMNGETGVFIGVKDFTNKNGTTEKKAVFDFGLDRIIHKGLKCDEIMISYAATCHKFQGSESPHVIVVAGKSGSRVIDRSWIYTAITRAKSSCVLVAPSKLINNACSVKAKVLKRKTFLQAKLEGTFDPDAMLKKQIEDHRNKKLNRPTTVDGLL